VVDNSHSHGEDMGIHVHLKTVDYGQIRYRKGCPALVEGVEWRYRERDVDLPLPMSVTHIGITLGLPSVVVLLR
jgi:hypothetical protein